MAEAKKAPARKKAAVGDTYECEVCGLVVSVDEVCGCVDTCDIICCNQPMTAKKSRRAAKKIEVKSPTK
jgi:glycerate-2-kinase